MRVLAAISGGVDSAVAAARLVAGGHEVVGAHLRTGMEIDGDDAAAARRCCSADHARDARAVAARLGIPFHLVDVRDAFEFVVEEFVAEYAAGRTPNTCILCNQVVKFGRLLDVAHELGAERVATGHYARTASDAHGRMRLLRSIDAHKDQTYVLHALGQAQLAAAVFPLGEVSGKAAVREEAERLGLEVARKPDSQDLCFVAAGGPRAFLRAQDPSCLVPGTFVDEEGRVVGRHDGAAAYTRGQRHGLPALGEPHYVHHVDASGGCVTIAQRAAVMERNVHVRGLNWIERDEPPADACFEVEARIRHASSPWPALLRALGGGRADVVFDEPVFAPTPGQALVAYVGEAVLCGGRIGELPEGRSSAGCGQA